MSDSHRKHTPPKEYGRRRPRSKIAPAPSPLKRGKQLRADEKRAWQREYPDDPTSN